MANRLSIDWPRSYFEALEQVAELPEYAGKLAIFPVAEEGQSFRAGNFRGAYGTSVRQDTAYLVLENRKSNGSTLGYAPSVHLQFEVLVPEGNIGCVMIYDRSVALSGVRARAQQIELARQSQLPVLPSAESETPMSAPLGELRQ